MRVVVFLFVPIQVAEFEQQHTLLNAVTCGTAVAAFVGTDGVERVALRKIYVSDGVVDLVEIVFVLVRSCHALQSRNHLFALTARRQHFGECNACVELHLIGRIHAYDAAVGFRSLVLVAESRLELSHEIPLTGFLFVSHLMADDLA